jgi:cytochrome P450
MTLDATIPLLPVPPSRRLSFLRLMIEMVKNPLGSWGEDFYDEPVIVYRNFGLENAFVMDPELIQTMLLDDSESFTKRPIYDHVLGEGGGKGLLIAEGEHWRWQRRLMASLFRAEDLLAYVPVFAADVEALLARWREAPPGSIEVIDTAVGTATLKALQDTVLGTELSPYDRILARQAAAAFLEPTVWKVAFASLNLPSWLPHPGALRMRRASRNLRATAARALAARRQNNREGSDLLWRLMTAKDPSTGARMPDSLIIDNVVTFFIAGHETTAQALTWTLYLLALMPEWQERAREEVKRVAGGSTVTRECVEGLDLLEMIVLEAMRLYPPAPTLMRRTLKPVRLGPVELGAGAIIVLPIYVVHRHRSLWSDPLRFDPMRFEPEKKARRQRFAYMPFGAGPRGCIGSTFSVLEAKVMLAALLNSARFDLTENEMPTPLARITLRPKNGLRLKITML